MKNLVIEEIIKFADTIQNKTIFDILDNCIEKAESPINKNWFIELKYKIEEELKKYAWEHYIPINWVMKNNRVVRIENGLKVTNQTKDFVYLELYFPSEFNPNSLIIKSSFY